MTLVRFALSLTLMAFSLSARAEEGKNRYLRINEAHHYLMQGIGYQKAKLDLERHMQTASFPLSAEYAAFFADGDNEGTVEVVYFFKTSDGVVLDEAAGVLKARVKTDGHDVQDVGTVVYERIQ